MTLTRCELELEVEMVCWETWLFEEVASSRFAANLVILRLSKL